MAFVPLGTLLLAGPGAIVATMLFVQRTGGSGDIVAFAVTIGAVTFRGGWRCGFPARFTGCCDSEVELLTRTAGLLLSAIAVQLIIGAVRTLVRQGAG